MRTAAGIGWIGLVAASLFLCAAAGADGTLYRWVDKDGRVHYGDDPAAANNARQVEPNPLNSGGGSGSSSGGDDAAAQKQTAECKSKSDLLGRYKNAATISETDALGNTREYSADEKDQLVAKTQKYVDDHCAAAATPAN